MIPRFKRSWNDISEELPVDVLPCSNGEFYPKPATREQVQIMELANQETERWRRRMGMPRRDFVRTAMAMTIGFWAINQVHKGKFGYYAPAHNTKTTDACDLEWANHPDKMATLANLPGEFIFDVQSHHVESDGMWRVTNPAFHAFFAGVWGQAGPVTGGRPGLRDDGSIRGGGAGELDPIENLSRYHYLKELFLDSATTMTVLSAVPAAPDINQPLPIERAALTVQMVNELAGSQRTVMHAFVMPNRGSAGSVASTFGKEPVYMQREFETMVQRADLFGSIIRGWKTYPAWGDVPYASGWFFDDELVGQRFIDHVRAVSAKYPKCPPNIATHKGFALPGFDQRAASPRDIGPAASRNKDVNFIVYHSGYDGEAMLAYPGDAAVSSADRTVNSLIKSLRESAWSTASAGATVEGFTTIPGVRWANVKNVFAELGSTWRSVMNNPDAAVHLLGKLITHVGPKRIAWGTDSLWFGSPQSEIVALRKLQFTQAGKDLYGLPYGIDGDADDPTKPTKSAPGHENDPNASDPTNSIRNWIFGRGAAEVYRVNAGAHRTDRGIKDKNGTVIADATADIKCDDVQRIRDAYILNQYTPYEQVPMASNTLIGARNKGELVKQRKEQPWGP